MPSEISIINDALGELGEPTITARTDNTPQARAADRFFDQAKLELLEEHTWRFAAKQQTLAQLAGAPLFKYTYAYQLPGDFVRLDEINETTLSNVVVPLYEIVKDQIHTDETSVKIVFTSNVDISEFSPGAARSLSFKMGAKMARLLTDSTIQRQEMLDGYKGALKSAKATDSMHQRQPIEASASYSGFLQAFGGLATPNPTVTASAL